MSGKRKDSSPQTASSQPRKQCVIANDIQWACDHKESLTIRAYAEEFGILDKQQAMVRYRNIIKSPLLATDEARLHQELHIYKQTEDYKRFWLERTRSKANPDAHDACATFIQNVVNQEASLLEMQPGIASAASAASNTSNLSLDEDGTASKAPSEPTTPIPNATTTTADTTPTGNDQDIFLSAPDTIPDGVENVIPLQPWIYRGTNVAE